jgi:tRNA dimethylallyltransferase
MKGKGKGVIILLGPTGVGKTGVSLLLAEDLDTEIISADSMQIFRGMDIGTAKPTVEERKRVKHHMIDIVDPSDSYSVGRYIDEVKPIIEMLHDGGKVPLIVGGTGLYIKALTRGIFSAPEADHELRAFLQEKERNSSGTLYEELKIRDPERAKDLNASDTRRIIRALEVVLKTERPMSILQKELTIPLPYDFLKIGLVRERKELYGIIEERVEEMFSAGLIGEIERLLSMNPSETPLQAIGYKEVIDHLKGERDIEETKRLVKKATKQYAKRQFTWFKREEHIHWVDITRLENHEDIFKKLKRETVVGKLLKHRKEANAH